MTHHSAGMGSEVLGTCPSSPGASPSSAHREAPPSTETGAGLGCKARRGETRPVFDQHGLLVARIHRLLNAAGLLSRVARL